MENPTPRGGSAPAALFNDISCGKSVQNGAVGKVCFFRFSGRTAQIFEKREILSVFHFFPHPFTQAKSFHKCGKPYVFCVRDFFFLFFPGFPQRDKRGKTGISGAFTQGFHRLLHDFSPSRKAYGQVGEKRAGRNYFSQISSRSVLMSNSKTGSCTIFFCTHSCEAMMVE